MNIKKVRIGEICEINPRHKRNINEKLKVTFVPMAAVDEYLGEITAPEIRPYGEVRSGYTHFEEGDILFAKITPCMENGKAAIARNLENGLGCGSTEFFVLRPGKALLPEFLYHFIRQEAFRIRARQAMTGTSGHQRVPKDFVENVEIPVPPLEIQRQIAARLDLLSSHNERAHSYLSAIPTLSERFRQSVLARAFTGELTADWRRANPDVEPASELLERIKVERRQKWIHNYAKNLADRARNRAEKQGKPFGDDKWQAYYESKLKAGAKKYEEPQAPDPEKEGLPEIPESWEWVRFAGVAWDWGYGTSVKCDYEAPGPPVLRIPNIVNGKVLFEDLKNASTELDEDDSEFLSPGDFLLVRTNGSADLVGLGALISEKLSQRYHFASYLIRYRFCGETPLWHWLNLAWHSPFIRQNIIQLAASSAGQHNISVSKIEELAFPLPPLAEQQEIVRRTSDLLDMLTTFEAQTGEARALLDRLKSSTLSAMLGA